MTKKQDSVSLFEDLKILPEILTILKNNNFINPTPIQHQVIPVAVEGNDVVGIAQTGTGKTLAFGVPLIQSLLQKKGQALILLPTRELALQVNDVLKIFCRKLKIDTAVLIGGTSVHGQKRDLSKNPSIIVATPGRLDDHIRQGNYSLKLLNTIILDEADRMLDIGFSKQIINILNNAPKERQMFLFSATMPDKIAKLAIRYMKTPLRIEVATQGSASDNVEQEIFIVPKNEKINLLGHILNENSKTVLIFMRTKHSAKRLNQAIKVMGHTSSEIHSNRSLSQRKEALNGFKNGKYKILVATDIASRGIDVKDISLVINYDLPDDVSDYTHRIGRTGRANSKGKAITFVTQGEKYLIRKIERLTKKEIPISSTPSLTENPNLTESLKKISTDSGRSSRPKNDNRNNRSRRSSGNFKKKSSGYDHKKKSSSSSFDRNKSGKRGGFGKKRNNQKRR